MGLLIFQGMKWVKANLEFWLWEDIVGLYWGMQSRKAVKLHFYYSKLNRIMYTNACLESSVNFEKTHNIWIWNLQWMHPFSRYQHPSWEWRMLPGGRAVRDSGAETGCQSQTAWICAPTTRAILGKVLTLAFSSWNHKSIPHDCSEDWEMHIKHITQCFAYVMLNEC